MPQDRDRTSNERLPAGIRGAIRIGILIFPLSLCGLAATARAQEAAPVPAVRLPPELGRVLTDYEAGWKAGDGAALAQLFVEDGFVLPNGGPPVRGRAAIQQYYKSSGGPLALHTFAFATEGATGYIIGGFSRQEGQPDIGKFTLTLRKGSDRKWRIVSDMDNGNRPSSPRPSPSPTPTAAVPKP